MGVTLRYSHKISKHLMNPQALGRSWVQATFKTVRTWQTKREKGCFIPNSKKKKAIDEKEMGRPIIGFTTSGKVALHARSNI